jgi:pimeloyl-ACP methyl ester carboxylesterase
VSIERLARRAAFTTALALALAAGTALGAPGPPAPQHRLHGQRDGDRRPLRRRRDALGTWGPLRRALSGSARVCAYDRSGVGGTPITVGPQTFIQMADALHGALAEQGVSGPLILVGHSIGGAVAAAYAARYRADVTSLVLLDATPPTFVGRALRLIPASATGSAAQTRGELAPIIDWRANLEHGDGRRGFAQLRALRSLGSLRLAVLSHGDRFLDGLPTYGVALERLWQQGQRRWATLSTASPIP